MTSNIDPREFPSNLLRLSKQVLASITGTQPPVNQTFLLSPTPSEESLRPDSPVLQLFYGRDTLTTSNTSYTSTYSLSTSTGSTQENDQVTWRSVDARVSDILPDHMDLYADAEPHIQRENTETPDRRHYPITEQEPIFGPEVKTRLQNINEDDFPYYPLLSQSSLPAASAHEEAKIYPNDDARPANIRAMNLIISNVINVFEFTPPISLMTFLFKVSNPTKITMPPYSTPAYYHPTSPTSHSLPSDEYKYLKRQQEKSRLQWHLAKKHILPPRTILSTSSSSSFPSDYSSSSSSSSSSFPSTSTSSSFSSSSSSYTTPTLPPYPPTPYQTQRLPHAHRVHISAVKNATRKALASVFDTGTTDHDMYHEWPSSRYEHQ
ncbi:hypothetical protein BM1_02902 [Bipolaris maydis]|nr:hypothetical protein BM1_02902 [Bipolaris maydis]